MSSARKRTSTGKQGVLGKPGRVLALIGITVCLVGVVLTTFVQGWFGAGLNPMGFLALGVTIYALYVSLRILALQGKQGVDQELRYGALFSEIKSLASSASIESAGANHGVADLTRQLQAAFALRPEVQPPDLLEEMPRLYHRLQSASPALVLWVDDDPDMIERERAALLDGGVHSVWVPSTEDALKLVDGNEFDVIVTDMKRLDNDYAGYDLLDELRRSGDETPVLVYSSSDRPDHRQQVIEHEGQGATNSPLKILELIADQLLLLPR